MESKAPEFKNDDVIWAKVSGHPWWPGLITNSNRGEQAQLYRVDFFGFPPSHSLLPSSKIIPFEDYDKTVGCENRGRISPALKNAIKQANDYYHTLQQSKVSSPQKQAVSLYTYEEYTAFSVQRSNYKCIIQQKLDAKNSTNIFASFQNKQTNSHKKHKYIKKLNLKIKRKSVKTIEKNQISPQKQTQIEYSIEQQQNQQYEQVKPVQKPKQLKTHGKKPQNQSLTQAQIQSKQKEIMQLLRRYKIQQIPEIDRERTEDDVRRLTMFMYRFCRQFHSKTQSKRICLEAKDNIKGMKQLREFMNGCRSRDRGKNLECCFLSQKQGSKQDRNISRFNQQSKSQQVS